MIETLPCPNCGRLNRVDMEKPERAICEDCKGELKIEPQNIVKSELDNLIVMLREVQKNSLMKFPGFGAGISKTLQDFEQYREMIDSPASIMLMGRTGAGKSSFVNALVGDSELMKVGDSAYSETKKISETQYTTPNGVRLVFLDTRGSGESGIPDKETLHQIKEAAEKHKPTVAFILMPPDRAYWDEDLKFFSEALRLIHNSLGLKVKVFGIVTKVDSILEPFDANQKYDWKNPTTRGEIRLAEWCTRLQQSLAEELSQVDEQIEVFPVSTRYGRNDNDEDMDLRWGLDEVWLSLEKNAPFAFLMKLSEFVHPNKRRKLARNQVHRFALLAGGIGAVPIPLADATILAYLQYVLVRVIYTLSKNHKKAKPSVYMGFLGGVPKVIGKIIARQTVGWLTELIPGVGSAAGSVVNAGIAAGFTEAFGHAAIAYYFDNVPETEVMRMIKASKATKEYQSD